MAASRQVHLRGASLVLTGEVSNSFAGVVPYLSRNL